MSILQRVISCLAVAAVLGHCPGCGPGLGPLGGAPGTNDPLTGASDQSAGDPTEPGTADREIGIWERQAGAILADHQYTGFELEALVLRDDGSATAHFLEPLTGLANCFSGEAERVGDDGIILNIAGLTDVLLPDGSIGSTSQLLTLSQQDDQSLELLDADGSLARFTRRTEVPLDVRCKSLRIIQTHTYGGIQPSLGGGGLAYDGALWFYDSASDTVRSVDPKDGTLGAGVTLDRHPYVHASQDGDFWAHCSCSGTNTPELVRVTKQDVRVDAVHFEDDLNRSRLSIPESIAVSGDRVLINAQENGSLKLLEVDVTTAPRIVREAAINHVVTAMAWVGDDLWAIVEGQRQMVVRFDAQSLIPQATYQGLDPGVSWLGIAMDGLDLFVVGRDSASGSAVLVQAGTSLLPTLPNGPGSALDAGLAAVAPAN